MAIVDIYPQTRQEEYLKKIADGEKTDLDALGEPQTRTEYYLRQIAENGAGGAVDAYTKAESDEIFLSKEAAESTYIAGANVKAVTNAEITAMWPDDSGMKDYN